MPVWCEADLECGGLTPLWLAPTGRDINGWAPRQADTLGQAYRSAQGSHIAESGVKPPHSKLKICRSRRNCNAPHAFLLCTICH
jgi:hypothetical protein